MWTQNWSVTHLKIVHREERKIIVENGGKHPGSSTALLYLPREKGGRGLHAVETEYKVTKVKAVVRLYKNKDPAMGMVREFEERAESLSVARSIYWVHISLFPFIYNRSSNMNLYFIYTSHHFTPHRRYELHKLTSLPMCDFIAQLVEHRTSIRGGHRFESRWSPDFFFQGSSFQLLKLEIYCNDHSSLLINRIYNKITDCDWFPGRLFTRMRSNPR